VISALSNNDIDLLVLPEFFCNRYQILLIVMTCQNCRVCTGRIHNKNAFGLSLKRRVHCGRSSERHGDKFYNSAVPYRTGRLQSCFTGRRIFILRKIFYFTPGDTGFKVWGHKSGTHRHHDMFWLVFPEAARTSPFPAQIVVAHPSILFCPTALIPCLWGVLRTGCSHNGKQDRDGAQKKGPAPELHREKRDRFPDGKILKRASEHEEALMITEIDPKAARDKILNPLMIFLRTRRPEMYPGTI